MIYEVTVPAGCRPGDTFQVEIGDEVFEVTTPSGCGAGSSIEIRCGPLHAGTMADDGASMLLDEMGQLRFDDDTASQMTFQVEVPVGYRPGDELLIDTPDGRTVAVLVPSGGLPGTLVEVALPDASVCEPPLDDPKDGLHTAVDGSPNCVRAHLDQLSDAMEPLPAALAISASSTSLSACDDFEEDFDFDDSYMIQRSDGSYSEGWIKEHDWSCDLYHVLIVGAGYKWVCREQIECNTVHF